LLTPAGIPYIFMKQRTHQQHPTHELAASGLLLASAVAVAGLFALIHLETRYRLVVTPESLGAAAFVGHTLAVRRSERLAQVALPSGPPTV
jgi:hypothetical protein